MGVWGCGKMVVGGTGRGGRRWVVSRKKEKRQWNPGSLRGGCGGGELTEGV